MILAPSKFGVLCWESYKRLRPSVIYHWIQVPNIIQIFLPIFCRLNPTHAIGRAHCRGQEIYHVIEREKPYPDARSNEWTLRWRTRIWKLGRSMIGNGLNDIYNKTNLKGHNPNLKRTITFLQNFKQPLRSRNFIKYFWNTVVQFLSTQGQ